MTYVGPEWLKTSQDYQLQLARGVIIPERTLAAKAMGLILGRFADRVTPFSRGWIRGNAPSGSVVYFNGEAAGASVAFARKRGLPSIFIPHNYAPEYLVAEGGRVGWLERRRNKILSEGAFAGYGNADARICLTNQDRENYEQACGRTSRNCVISPCYFAYQGGQVASRNNHAASSKPTILINSNLALDANVRGATLFLKDCWPAIRNGTSARLVLAGRWPKPELLRLAHGDPRIQIVTRPEPEEMEAVFQKATVCLAIAFEGSGIKLRVAEALRRGIPVIATTHCSRGYEEVSPEVLRVSDTAEGLVSAVENFLSTDATRITRRCLDEHARLFSFEAGLARMRGLEEIFESIR